ncbi:hypothetical protein [Streptomyces monomycini]|uniref:hypothetical protein n=1 Tax=Streptomyces monomycini TaxID=371720 RepID=UPI0004AB0812|nr:hypothetical protein [Streptomyces monomycini]
MEAVAAIFGLLFLLFVAAGVFVTVKAVKAAKRGVDRGVAQARRTVEDTTLRARQFTQPGVAGELAQLRLSLRTSMRATQDALHTGAEQDTSLTEALGLFERLSAHGHELDDELKRLEREPAKAGIAARLPELRERLERITHSAESLRWAARDRARQFADDDLAALGEQIDMEAGALRHWSKEPLEDRIEASGGASAAAGAGAPGGAAGTSSEEAAAGRKSWRAAEDETPAITARDPRTQPTYAWQKAPRTERTT